MHEYSLARSLLDLVESQARVRQARGVRRLWIRIGVLGGVDAGLLRAAYELCRAGTACASAALEIELVTAQWVCGACSHQVPASGPRRCPSCGEAARLIAGDDLVLERIELEIDDV